MVNSDKDIAGHDDVRREKIVAHANEPLAALSEIVASGRDNGQNWMCRLCCSDGNNNGVPGAREVCGK